MQAGEEASTLPRAIVRMPGLLAVNPGAAIFLRVEFGDWAECGDYLMRWLMRVLVPIVLLLVAYAAWPVYSALEICDAVIAGDTQTLNRKVDWDALRASLKTSITPETIARLDGRSAGAQTLRSGNASRQRSPLSMADTVIDRYVTPEHLPVLLGYRQVHLGTVQPGAGPRRADNGTRRHMARRDPALDRFASFWVRVRRAVFYSPTRFLLDVEDKYRPGRRYIGTLELKGFEWKLTGLSITGDWLLRAPRPSCPMRKLLPLSLPLFLVLAYGAWPPLVGLAAALCRQGA